MQEEAVLVLKATVILLFAIHGVRQTHMAKSKRAFYKVFISYYLTVPQKTMYLSS